MSARAAAILVVLLASCSRKGTPIRADDRPADAGADNGADAVADVETPRFDGRKRRDLPVGTRCIATDALYVREGARVVRLTGSAPEVTIEPPSGFARANEWTARDGWYAWTELEDGGVDTTLYVWSTSGGRSSRHAPSTSPDSLRPILCGDRVAYIEGSFIFSPASTHAARTDIFRLERLAGGSGGELRSGLYVSVHPFACAGGQPLVLFNDIAEPVLYAIDPASGAKRRLISRPGEWWLRHAAADGRAVFLSTEGDVIERMKLEGGPPTTIFKAAPDERLWSVFASSGSVLVPTTIEVSTGLYPHSVVHQHHALVELDAASGALRRRLVTDGEVLAAFRGDGLTWCTEHAVYSLP